MTFPFGRWRGHDVTAVPLDYLRWAKTIAREPLRSAIDAELSRRRAREHAENGLTPSRPPDELRPALRDIVRRGHRACASTAHPDHGGTHEEMVVLNRVREWLEAWVGV